MHEHRVKRNHSRTAAFFSAVIVIASVFSADPVVASEEKNVEKISLNKLAKKPAQFKGKEIRLEGVVTRVMTDDRLFLIVDKSACGGCPSKKKCGVFELPVHYEGKLPKTRKSVKITGVLTEPEDGRYLFKASKLE
jgi:hypothetical protein